MKLLYMVTDGDYPHGVYSSEAIANRVAAALALRVEEIKLDEHDPAEWPNEMRSFCVGADIPTTMESMSAYVCATPPAKEPKWRLYAIRAGVPRRAEIIVWAKDRDDAIRVAKSITRGLP